MINSGYLIWNSMVLDSLTRKCSLVNCQGLDTFIKRSKTINVGLPQTVCSFVYVCGLSGDEITIFVLPFKDDAGNKSNSFLLTICLLSHHAQRDKKGCMRFRALTAIRDWKPNLSLGSLWPGSRSNNIGLYISAFLTRVVLLVTWNFRKCSSSRKLVILFVVIAAAVIVLELGVIVSVVCSIVLCKGFKPFNARRYGSCKITRNFWVRAEDIPLLFGHMIAVWLPEKPSTLLSHTINLVI